MCETKQEVSQMKVDNRIVQEADNMAKETRIPFRQCLDILVKAYLQTQPVQPVNTGRVTPFLV